MKIIKLILSIFVLMLVSTTLNAQSAVEDVEYLDLFEYQDPTFIVGSGEDALEIHRVMRPCGMNKGHLQPLIPAQGVTLVGEREMLPALNDKDALIVDMRLESEFFIQTIPGAINVSYLDVEPHMDTLGCNKKGGKWDCSNAKKIYTFCNGPVCTKSPIGIRKLISLGFPPQKIFYYRGGMLVWSAIGLTMVEGEF
ncbi:MAG: rhodanese-like domain-containing protein [Sulfuricurvum sp.]|nr:rhodanese-like domain-containing protein [Sulfuricurvum sp.]MDP3021862.1 rhodanese-like domain-containing protein [Sulfuricurvum sp.]MDP3120240.1 rhodanese-like domain-containing protein [Sulfuricurvum sp.]